MPLIRRSDGTFVARAPTLRRMMPFLMPTRNESVVYFEQQIEVARALAFVEKLNAGRPPERRVTLFQIVLFTMMRMLTLRPDLNRFIVGRRVYQRAGIDLSFAVKKQKTDAARLTTVKVRLDPADTLAEALAKMEGHIGEGRGEKPMRSETEMDIVTLLPRGVLRFVMWAQRALDYWNLLPAAMIAPDPLYASMFFANLGSVGLDSAYHHLYEYGTVPIFATMGKVQKAVVPGPGDQPVVRDVVSLKYSYDERIADGLYCAKGLDLIKRFLEEPELLERPLEAPLGSGAAPPAPVSV